MMENKNWHFLIVCALFLFTVGGAIFILRLCPAPEGVDDYSILIASLTSIVAVLIGFQIWNIVQLDKRFENAKQESVELMKEEIKRIEIELKDYAQKVGISQLGLSMSTIAVNYSVKAKRQNAAAHAYLQSMTCLHESGAYQDETLKKSWDETVQNFCHLIQDHTTDPNLKIKIYITNGFKLKCLEAALSVEDPCSRQIITRFLNSDAVAEKTDE